MCQNTLSARVAPFILAELGKMAAEQGVSVSQLVNLALGQFVAMHREPGMLARVDGVGRRPEARAEALAILDGLGTDEPLHGDEWDGVSEAQAARHAS